MERSGPSAKEKTRKRHARKRSDGESPPESPRLTVNPHILARFGEFAEQSSQFTREIVERSGTQSMTASDARLNIRIARTVFSKWSVEILTFLFTEGASRFQEIKKAFRDISARVLSVKLARLERLGFVRRSVRDTDDQRLGLGRRSGPTLDQIGEARNPDEESEAKADDRDDRPEDGEGETRAHPYLGTGRRGHALPRGRTLA